MFVCCNYWGGVMVCFQKLGSFIWNADPHTPNVHELVLDCVCVCSCVCVCVCDSMLVRMCVHVCVWVYLCAWRRKSAKQECCLILFLHITTYMCTLIHVCVYLVLMAIAKQHAVWLLLHRFFTACRSPWTRRGTKSDRPIRMWVHSVTHKPLGFHMVSAFDGEDDDDDDN